MAAEKKSKAGGVRLGVGRPRDDTKISVHIKMDRDTAAALRKYALEKKITQNQVIMQALRLYAMAVD